MIAGLMFVLGSAIFGALLFIGLTLESLVELLEKRLPAAPRSKENNDAE